MDTGSLKIIEVKKPKDEHRRALVDLVNAYLSGDMGEGRLLDKAQQRRLAARLFSHPGTLVFFAREGKKFVGLAVCFTGFSTFYARKLINIHDLIVLPQYRKRGVATRLLEAVEDKGRRISCCKLTLEVREDNLKAKRLYKELGFSEGKAPMRFWTKLL